MYNQPPEELPEESQESSPFFSMDQPVFTSELNEDQPNRVGLFGLTPVQRFVIMLLIFIIPAFWAVYAC